MKASESLLQSAKARLQQAMKHARRVERLILDMNDTGITLGEIHELRDSAEHVVQCVHEFSAYWNAYETQ